MQLFLLPAFVMSKLMWWRFSRLLVTGCWLGHMQRLAWCHLLRSTLETDQWVFPSALPCGNTVMPLFSCRLLSPRVLQVNVWPSETEHVESAAWSVTSHECLLSRVTLLSAIYFSDLSSLCCLKLFNELHDTEFLEKLSRLLCQWCRVPDCFCIWQANAVWWGALWPCGFDRNTVGNLFLYHPFFR